MSQILVPPLTFEDLQNPDTMNDWLNRLNIRINESTQVTWTQVDTTGSNLTDITTRLHASLQSIGEVDDTSTDATKDKHTSNLLAKNSTDHIAASNPHSGSASTSDLTTHAALTTTHGATGNIVGTGDTATTVTAGVVVQGAAVTDLNQTISATYSQAEVQAISDKVDELLGSLRTAEIINT